MIDEGVLCSITSTSAVEFYCIELLNWRSGGTFFLFCELYDLAGLNYCSNR